MIARKLPRTLFDDVNDHQRSKHDGIHWITHNAKFAPKLAQTAILTYRGSMREGEDIQRLWAH